MTSDDAAGKYLFYDATDGTNKGFAKASGLFDYVYKAEKSKAVIANNAAANTLILSTVTHDDSKKPEYNDATVGLAKIPVITVAAGGSKGYIWTCTVTVTPGKSTDFYTNGKLYSAAALTLSQTSKNAAFGITHRYLAAKAVTSNMIISPAIKSGTLATPNVDGLATDAFTYYTNSGMALTSGTVSASNSTVQAFKVGTNGTLGFNVTHTAKLKDKITTTAIEVQQVTCLTIFTTAPAQYLCLLTDIATTTANKEATKYKVTHEVYTMDAAVKATNVKEAAKALNDATNLGAATNKSALMYKAISKEVTVGTEAVLNGMDIPSTKMTWPGGNYLSMDLQNMQAKIGFVGETMKSGASSAGDNKTTVDAIKKGLAAAFTGTAAKSGSTWVTKTSDTSKLDVKTAASCDNPTEATCKTKYPNTCKASGALSTVATVGAAIAALAMSF